MPHPEINGERGTAQETGEQHDLAVMLTDGIDELNAPTSKDLYINASASTVLPRFFRVATEFTSMFVTQTWHRLYAGALLETETIRLSLFILLAEEELTVRRIDPDSQRGRDRARGTVGVAALEKVVTYHT